MRASSKSNLSSVPRGIVDSYSNLPWVMAEVVTVVEGIPWWGLLWHKPANGVLVYPSQGAVLKAAGRWGRECSVLNEPLGEPGRTPLYVSLVSMWGSVKGDQMFSRFSPEGSLLGTPTDINEWINHWLWRWSSSLHRDPVRESAGELIYQGLWGKGEEANSGDGCLSPQGPFGEPG
jgi:hypothetical protein